MRSRCRVLGSQHHVKLTVKPAVLFGDETAVLYVLAERIRLIDGRRAVLCFVIGSWRVLGGNGFSKQQIPQLCVCTCCLTSSCLSGCVSDSLTFDWLQAAPASVTSTEMFLVWCTREFWKKLVQYDSMLTDNAYKSCSLQYWIISFTMIYYV